MTGRIAWIELRRSAALWLAVPIAVLVRALLEDPERWDGLWMWTVLVHEYNLGLVWPLALAAGAWLGRRERAVRITDLTASMPRSGISRVAPRAAVIAGCLAVGYVLGLFEGLARAVLAASYRPPDWYWPVLVGVLGIGAAGVLGLGLGRLMPSRLTAPLLALGGLVVTVAPLVLWENSRSRALLLIPGYLGSTDEYSIVDWRSNAGQALWFTAIAATGWALCAAGAVRARLLALVPAAAGLVVALAVLPTADRATHQDPRAVEQVCAAGVPKVCVTRLYEPVLPQVVEPARRALALLARLPHPPTAVVQEPSAYGAIIPQRRDTVSLRLTVFGDGTVAGGQGAVEDDILDGAGTWSCGAANADTEAWYRIEAARTTARLWLRGVDTVPEYTWDPVRELIERALATLRALPEQAQLTRIAAMREAALACRPDVYDVLTRG